MVKLTKIYTKGGDKGETSLTGGKRVKKHAARIEAYGAVDEVNAAVGLVRLNAPDDIDAMLARIQNDLFDLGADLSTPHDHPKAALRITEAQVKRLEDEMDAINEKLSDLTSFILPGGSDTAAHLHLARTITRRAERHTTKLMEAEEINPLALQYLNRLSDHLFILSRAANNMGADDVLWVPGGAR
ncbi:MAG: cob(I)yrinic acid a,c-diamide adenosyltransferase [Sphingomonadales bacterium]|nr:cob(I)yrinic acid a,c-diamide adenosyltransferase [Sphingomonadales bacterium]